MAEESAYLDSSVVVKRYASALIIQEDSGATLTFITADERQRAGAVGSGLQVLSLD